MLVFIAGGGRTGAQLASQLLQQKYNVRLVEHRRELLSRLHHELPTEVIYEGQATNPNVLKQAGLDQAQVLVACTQDDAANLVLCYLARTMFKVRRTVARINNPRNAWLFDKNFHVDETINQADVMAHLIQEEMSLGDMMTLLKLRRGRYSLVEEKVPKGAKAIGVQIKDLGLPDQCVIAAIIRKGQVTLPRGAASLEEFDEVLAITDEEGAKQLALLLEPPDRSVL
ncbi:MAG: potassium transporter TrkA [Chloroflexi bacterium]|nr:TrkA family potassium uptake protein [Chloroflexi bacterium CFX1]MCK6567801.1 NAD-binding protein [Anaerolineales bacterium]MCQ3953582.1 TrkA family potassium uptake protein [Chloroflexota bacterium]MDL1920427.1 TrkA family potassium uptake protein [Chloroflexi bacterium CFX5]NUQ59407.1 NAD-binding protein [Anaerolineales bacterium]